MSISTYLSSHESSESVTSSEVSIAVSSPHSTDNQEKMILKHIDGYATTGEMTAILGARLAQLGTWNVVALERQLSSPFSVDGTATIRGSSGSTDAKWVLLR